jgi:predicted transcriptional regulator with HTH domain
MPQISEEKRKKISEQILYHLYSIFPKQIFTSDVAREMARDEEFTKKILIDMEKKGLIVKIDKNPKGIKYELRLRWRISNKAYSAYSQMQ